MRSLGFLSSALLSSAPAPGQNAALFDGTNDFMSRGGALTGIADGKLGLLSFWIKPNGGDGVTQTFFIGTGSHDALKVFKNTSNLIRILGYNSSSTEILDLRSDTALTDDNAWHHVLASWNIETATGHLYLDDTDVTNLANSTDDDIDYAVTSADWHFGGNSSAEKSDACFSEVYFNAAAYLDLDTESNRRKFIDASGEPVALGANGETPTTSSPEVYFNGDSSTFQTNKGTGGDFTVTGSLTACDDTPSTD